jgi:hypothetical protein
MNSDSAAITAICGSANSITGLSQEASERPAPNQITIAEREEAEERHHRIGRDLTARGLSQQTNQTRGERDREHGHEDRACKTREFPEERPIKDHAILSLWNLA